MSILLFFQKLNRALLKIASWGAIIALAIVTLVIPYAVFSRYVLKNSPSWSDELSLFCLVWISMLGATVSLKKGYQVGITFFLNKSPRAVSAVLRVVGYALMIAVFAVLIVFGIRQTITNLRQLSAALQIPMSIPYAALPVGFFMMLSITVEDLLAFLLGVEKKPTDGTGGAQ